MRKFLSVLLAMAMVLSLTVTSFAADTAADAKAEMAGKTVILHTNDVHGAIEGYAYITALKADYEAKGAEVILVDAGDYSQGEVYVSDTKGLDAVEMMNVTGYDVVTLGNHEFDNGIDTLAVILQKARFPMISSNYEVDNTPIKNQIQPYLILKKFGLKIGIMALNVDPKSLIIESNYRGLVYRDPIEKAQELSAFLKNKKKCEKNLKKR